VTARCDWRIADLVAGEKPVSLYLVVPPSDINRTKPLIRLLLNQVGRRLTEDLKTSAKHHRLLLMLDEFPALGRLDFFESALAFMAGYGIKSFLIAQSLNQIEKAYGANNSVLDNCHVRVAFATNDERTAKRVSDALGTATEMRDSTNYAGHRLSPWLGHLMVSRQETARPLLTPGEVMQLPSADELLLVAGCRRSGRRKPATMRTPGSANASCRRRRPARQKRRQRHTLTTGRRRRSRLHRQEPQQGAAAAVLPIRPMPASAASWNCRSMRRSRRRITR
jgi:type IV secretory pathway TraG/TraD family ATPase VirD4